MVKNFINIHRDIFKEGGNKVKTFTIKKDRVVSELRETINLLSDEVLPPLEDLIVLIKEKKVTDKELMTNFMCKNILATHKEFKNSPSGMLMTFRDTLSNVVMKEQDIIKCIDKTFKSAVVTDRTITMGELCVIDLVKAINLVTTYMSDLLLVICFDLRGGSSLNKKFLSKVNACIVGFVEAIKNLEPKKLQEKLDKIPSLPRDKVGEAITTALEEGVDVDNLSEESSTAVGMLKSVVSGVTNVFSSITSGSIGRSGFVYSPIYHLRMAWADFQVSRYESLKNNKQATEAILLDLRLKKEGSNDPTIDKQIKYYEDKLTNIQYKIDEYEKEFRDENY